MKKFFILALLALSMNLFAQKNEEDPTFVNLTEEERSMSRGAHNAIVVDLRGVDNAKDAAKAWSKHMRDYGRTKRDRSTNEWLTDDAEIEGMNDGNTVDVYAKVESAGENFEIVVWFHLGGTQYLSSENAEWYAKGREIVASFALDQSRELIKEELEAQEKSLEDLQDELEDLEKEKGKYEDNIEDYKKDIEKAKNNIADTETKIEENTAAQGRKNKEIEAQRSRVEEIKAKLNLFD